MCFKICVVGCGYMALNGHGPALRKYREQHPDVELTACCDIDGSKALAFKKEFGFIRAYSDMEKMLEAEKPQAVSLIVPAELTCLMSLRVFQRGIPLLMEKPPGMSKEEILKMIKAADNKDTPNMAAFNRRFMPLVIRLKEELDKLGALNPANIGYRMLRVNRRDRDFASTAIHGIDVVKYLAASDYENIEIRYQEMDNIGEQMANFHLYCRFESGASARLDFLPMSGLVAETLEMNVPGHTFLLSLPVQGASRDSGRLVHMYNGEKVLEVEGSVLAGCRDEFVLGGFYNENKVFLDDIRIGRKPEASLRDCIQSVEIADCIRNRADSYRTG